MHWLGRHLRQTQDKGTILQPDKGKCLEVHVDANFTGNWDPKEPEKDSGTAHSRHGHITTYAGCPMLWKSQLQTKIALSSCESKHTGRSHFLHDTTPIMNMLKEMKARGFPMHAAKAAVHCKVFKDDSGALEIAKVHKFRPQTKHLNAKSHHFRSCVDTDQVTMHKASAHDQRADHLTKPATWEILKIHRKEIMGW